MRRGSSSLALLLGLLGVYACDSSPTAADGPVARLGEPFSLHIGETATVAGEGLSVALRGVPGDSRCPLNVTCIWAGDATIQLRLRKEGSAEAEIELHTNEGPTEAPYQGYTIALRKLEPYPRDGVAITPGDYVVTLLAARG